MKRHRIAWIGYDHPHVVPHLRVLSSIDAVEAILVRHADAGAIRNALGSAAGRIVAAGDSFEALLARDDADAAVVCARPDEAAAWCVKAAEAGKHVLAEKTIGRRSADVREVIDAADRNGVRAGAIFVYRYHPTVVAMRERLREGAFGRIVHFEARIVGSLARYRTGYPWLFDRGAAGGGVVAWLGCHMVDLVLHLTGDAVAEARALTARTCPETFGVEDAASAALRLGGGAIGTLSAAYLMPVTPKGYAGGDYDGNLTMRGTEGNFSLSPFSGEAYFESLAGGWSDPPKNRLSFDTSGYAAAYFIDFLRAADGECEPPASAEDALRAIEAIETIYGEGDRP